MKVKKMRNGRAVSIVHDASKIDHRENRSRGFRAKRPEVSEPALSKIEWRHAYLKVVTVNIDNLEIIGGREPFRSRRIDKKFSGQSHRESRCDFCRIRLHLKTSSRKSKKAQLHIHFSRSHASFSKNLRVTTFA
jgi:hypothetical protein